MRGWNHRVKTDSRSADAAVSDEHGHRVALGLVDGLGDVSRVLAVDLQRKRLVTAHDDPVEIEGGERLPSFRPVPRTPWIDDARKVSSRTLTGARYASPSSKLAPGTRSSATEPANV